MGLVCSSVRNYCNRSLHSMRGYKTCPYTGILHNRYNHIREQTRCDMCGLITLCNVSCESPWHSNIHRICNYCGGEYASYIS